MATLRGNDGLVSLGGYVVGSPLLQGSVAQGLTAATLDGGGSALNGIVKPGDTFTVAGDGQTYTIVTAGVIGVDTTPPDTANEIDITFSPAVVPGGGWADNTAVTFTSNSIARVKSFNANADRQLLDATVMRDTGRTYAGGFVNWTGSVMCLLDPADTEQADLIDQTLDQAQAAEFSLVLVNADLTHWYGDVTATRHAMTQGIDAMVEATFEFQGRGALGVDFN